MFPRYNGISGIKSKTKSNDVESNKIWYMVSSISDLCFASDMFPRFRMKMSGEDEGIFIVFISFYELFIAFKLSDIHSSSEKLTNIPWWICLLSEKQHRIFSREKIWNANWTLYIINEKNLNICSLLINRSFLLSLDIKTCILNT